MKVASSHNELWQTTYNWLTLFGHPLNKKYCREEVSTHPDYPSLTAVTDFLDAGGMKYYDVPADDSYNKKFGYPLKQSKREHMYINSKCCEWSRSKDTNVDTIPAKHGDTVQKNSIALTPSFFVKWKKAAGKIRLTSIAHVAAAIR